MKLDIDPKVEHRVTAFLSGILCFLALAANSVVFITTTANLTWWFHAVGMLALLFLGVKFLILSVNEPSKHLPRNMDKLVQEVEDREKLKGALSEPIVKEQEGQITMCEEEPQQDGELTLLNEGGDLTMLGE